MEKPNYKDTLNLPKTDFSMKANLVSLEPKILSLWENLDIYQVIRQARKGKEKFILHDGPPYANGLIHIGHALNMILKDLVIKYMAMKGKDIPFIVGWDCHGLPVEHQLFKELKLTKHDVNVVDFRKKAKDFALQFVELQRKDFKRLGIVSDWNNPYLTLNPEYEYAVIKLLEYLVEDGYVYRGRKPVNWCNKCETALAEAEVEYENHVSPSIYVKFKVKEFKNDDLKKWANNDIFRLGPPQTPSRKRGEIYFVIWTTTPWTLMANVAVALHPKEKYIGLWGPDGDVWIVAKKLKSQFLKAIGKDDKDYEERFPKFGWGEGSNFEGSTYECPFGSREGKVVMADYVSMEDGTGCVHTAPGHGQEDYLTGKKYGLEIVMPVNEKGKFDSTVAEFSGMQVHEADSKIIESLNKKNSLLYSGKIEHSYPHCWRCRSPIITRATFQWFLSVDHNSLREKLLGEIENVHWVPASGKERMRGMLATRPDWCLSRQRLWGIPIPAIKCKNCSEVILDKEVIKKVAEIFKKSGSDAWFTYDAKEFLPVNFRCLKCNGKEFSKEFDILDVWFESGASFFAVVKNNPDLQFPADMYLEGSDQHRGWFQVSLIPSVAKEKIAPFKTILTHGFVVDGDGRKMSKSLGNVIVPQEIIKQYGAEILRLWAAYSDYREDVKLSEHIIKQLVDIYRKVRNTIKFILSNINDFNPGRNSLEATQLLEVDRFMLSKTMLFAQEVMSSYEDYSFYKVCQEIFNFCNLDLSAFYLDILKDRLYTFSPNSRERRSAQFVLYNILDVLLKTIAPILSFTAEEAYLAWGNLKNKQVSIFATSFDDTYHPEWINEAYNERWQKILALRSEVLKEIEKIREKGIIGSSLEVEVSLEFTGEEYNFYRSYTDILREVFIVSGVSIKEGNFNIGVEKTTGKKCLRCWNYRHDVGQNKEFPEMCNRCAKALGGV